MPLRIGFAGKMGSGKTTAANYLSWKYGVPVYHFAEPFKTIIAEIPEDRQKRSGVLWGWAARLFRGFEKQAEFVRRVSEQLEVESDPGCLAQAIGTIGREIDPDVWVKYLMPKLPKQSGAVVDDVRFPNEVQALEKAGFTVIRLAVPELSRRKRLILRGKGDARDLAHVTETALDGMDLPMLDNRTTIEALQRALDRIVEDGFSAVAR